MTGETADSVSICFYGVRSSVLTLCAPHTHEIDHHTSCCCQVISSLFFKQNHLYVAPLKLICDQPINREEVQNTVITLLMLMKSNCCSIDWFVFAPYQLKYF